MTDYSNGIAISQMVTLTFSQNIHKIQSSRCQFWNQRLHKIHKQGKRGHTSIRQFMQTQMADTIDMNNLLVVSLIQLNHKYTYNLQQKQDLLKESKCFEIFSLQIDIQLCSHETSLYKHGSENDIAFKGSSNSPAFNIDYIRIFAIQSKQAQCCLLAHQRSASVGNLAHNPFATKWNTIWQCYCHHKSTPPHHSFVWDHGQVLPALRINIYQSHSIQMTSICPSHGLLTP